MAYSYVNYIGDGTQANWTFTFPYLDQQNIYATVAGIRCAIDFVAPNTLQLFPTPPAGSAIQIFRDSITAATPNQWTDGSVLRDKDLNRLALFCLYCAQEQTDKGDINGTGGLSDSLGLSIQDILLGIEGLITIDQFGLDLVAKIDKIDSNSSAIVAEATTRAQALLDEAAARGAEATSITTAYQAADSSLSSRIDTLTAAVAGVGTAAITAETNARIDGDTALASQITTLAATVGSNTTAITTEQTARANADSALATRTAAIEAITAGIGGTTVVALIAAETTARTTADTANATATTTLQSSVTGLTTSLATVQAQANTSTTALGVVNANYTLKTEAIAGGKMAVAGIGLNSSATGTVVQSEIIFAADKFQFISTLSGTSETPQTLLQVGPVNGVNTLILAPTRIGDKTVGANMIVDGSIFANHMTVGSITTQSINGGAVCIVRNTAFNGASGNIGTVNNMQVSTPQIIPITNTSSYTTYCYGAREVKLTGFVGTWSAAVSSGDAKGMFYCTLVVRRVVNGTPTVVWASDTFMWTNTFGTTGSTTTLINEPNLVLLDTYSVGSPGTPVALYYDVVLSVQAQAPDSSHGGPSYSQGYTNIGITYPSLPYPGQRFISAIEYQR